MALMSWTRFPSVEDLDDDRTNHAATVPRLKALGDSADLGAEGKFFVRSEKGDDLVVESGEHHAF